MTDHASDELRSLGPLSPPAVGVAAAQVVSATPDPLRALIARWRKDCEHVRAEFQTIRKDHQEGPRYGIAAVEQCADELEAALSVSPPPQPATCQYCGQPMKDLHAL
jgi:hypothetical protein